MRLATIVKLGTPGLWPVYLWRWAQCDVDDLPPGWPGIIYL